MTKRLDQLDMFELGRLSSLLEKHTDAMADLIVPERAPGWQTLLDRINQWAINRKVALENRADGNGHLAVVFDKVCYRLWQRLPGHTKMMEIDLDGPPLSVKQKHQ